VYDKIENIEKEINLLKSKQAQLIEDAEVMEMLLMHKFNKDSRIQEWELNK